MECRVVDKDYHTSLGKDVFLECAEERLYFDVTLTGTEEVVEVHAHRCYWQPKAHSSKPCSRI
jgi:hypothetical protein